MSYEIIIKRTQIVQKKERGEWAVLEKRPWTHEDFDNKNRYYEDAQKIIERTPLKEVLGYRPEREISVKEEVEILKQTVDEIDLAAVIKAINGL